MRRVLIATIAIISVIAVTAHPLAASPDRCCFADGTPFSYVFNSTTFNAVASSGSNSNSMPIFGTAYQQADPTINKTYWEWRAFRQDGTWTSMQQWNWYDAAQSVWMLADKRSDSTPTCKVSTVVAPRSDLSLCIDTRSGYDFKGSVGVGSQQMYRYDVVSIWPGAGQTVIIDAANCAPVSRVGNSINPVSSSTGTFTDVRAAVNADLFKLPSDCRRAAIMQPLKGDEATNMVAAAIEARRAALV